MHYIFVAIWTGIIWLLGRIATYFGKKSIVVTGAISGFVALTLSLIATINLAVQTLIGGAQTVPGIIAFGWNLMPSNTVPCIGTMISVKIAVFVYRQSKEKIKTAVAASA